MSEPSDKQRIVPCPNCGEMNIECACMRSKCLRCGGPVGNITFTYCDDCFWVHEEEMDDQRDDNETVEPEAKRISDNNNFLADKKVGGE